MHSQTFNKMCRRATWAPQAASASRATGSQSIPTSGSKDLGVSQFAVNRRVPAPGVAGHSAHKKLQEHGAQPKVSGRRLVAFSLQLHGCSTRLLVLLQPDVNQTGIWEWTLMLASCPGSEVWLNVEFAQCS